MKNSEKLIIKDDLKAFEDFSKMSKVVFRDLMEWVKKNRNEQFSTSMMQLHFNKYLLDSLINGVIIPMPIDVYNKVICNYLIDRNNYLNARLKDFLAIHENDFWVE